MTDNDNFCNILVAEDNDVSRELMTSILETQGYKVFGAIDGGSAIEVLENNAIDMAFVDINMQPQGGFEFIKHLVIKGNKLPVVIVTSNTSSDVLSEASALGVGQVLNKPVNPELLLQIAQRILERQGYNISPMGVETHESKFTPEQLMQKTIELAQKNWEAKKGQPFAAIVADAEGQVLGAGVNGIASRVDPAAHAEVMAIRQAAEELDNTDLSACTLYCSGEPTMIGKALIMSVGITKVYYGMAHADITVAHEKPKAETEYTQLCRDEALAMYESCEDGG